MRNWMTNTVPPSVAQTTNTIGMLFLPLDMGNRRGYSSWAKRRMKSIAPPVRQVSSYTDFKSSLKESFVDPAGFLALGKTV
jgi:hypothetical protein